MKGFTYSYPISLQTIRYLLYFNITFSTWKLSDATLAEVRAMSKYRMDNLQKSATLLCIGGTDKRAGLIH